MTIKKAVRILKWYAKWRDEGYNPDDNTFKPDELDAAIRVAIDNLERCSAKASPESIMRAVERETGVSEQEMVSKQRHREYADARAISSWLIYRYTPMTLTSIGRSLGRDHVSVIHYIRKANEWMAEPRLNLRAARIITKLINELEDDDTTSD